MKILAMALFGRPAGAELAIWRLVDPIPLGKAAWLWCDRRPRGTSMPPDVLAIHSLLKAEAEAGGLPVRLDPDGKGVPTTWATARREDLRGLAIRLSLPVPAFLREAGR